MYKTEKQWLHSYNKRRAHWRHDGNPLRPHVCLTTEQHSDGYFDSRPLIRDKKLSREAASDLIDKFAKNNGDLKNVDRVVGPSAGGTILAQLIADEVGRRQARVCKWASPKKQGAGTTKQFIFDDPENCVQNGEVILLCDDVVSTGSSLDLVTRAIIAKSGSIILPHVLALVNRSGEPIVDGRTVISLITEKMSVWDPRECPLCGVGSRALLPKEVDSWFLLNAEY